MLDKTSLTLVRTCPEGLNIGSGYRPIRIYKSRWSPFDLNKPVEEWLVSFGFEAELIGPICPLVESTPYLGETHWCEDDGFFIFRTILTFAEGDFPCDKVIEKEFDRKLRLVNSCLSFVIRSCSKNKESNKT